MKRKERNKLDVECLSRAWKQAYKRKSNKHNRQKTKNIIKKEIENELL